MTGRVQAPYVQLRQLPVSRWALASAYTPPSRLCDQ